MKHRPCSIIIVSYRSGDFLLSCLDSIRRAGRGLEYEVIVYDNGNEAELAREVAQRFPDIKWLGDGRNVGFGTACNSAAREAKHPFLFFVNPDTLVSKDTFRTMLEYSEKHEELGALGCKILNSDGTLQWSCRRSFPSLQAAVFKTFGLANLFPKSRRFGEYNLTYLEEDEETEVDAISGSFFCVRKALYDKVGGFDEDFFMYGEDLDICYRIQKAGFPNRYYPGTSVVHFKGQSSRKRPLRSFFNFYQAMVIFARKHREFQPFPLFLVSLGILFSSFTGALQRLAPRWEAWVPDLLVTNLSLHLARIFFFPESSFSFGIHVFTSFMIFVSLVLDGEYRGNSLAPDRFLLKALAVGGAAGLAVFFASGELYPILGSLVGAFFLVFWRKIALIFLFFAQIVRGKTSRTIVLGTGEDTNRLLVGDEGRSLVPGRDILGAVSLRGDKKKSVAERHRIGTVADLPDLVRRTGACEIMAVGSLDGFSELEKSGELGLSRSLLVGEIETGSFLVVDLTFIQ